MAGDVDLDTSGGDAQIGRLMGNYVQVSTQDRGVATAGSGTASIGAIYADTLQLSSGEMQTNVSNLGVVSALIRLESCVLNIDGNISRC